MARSPPPPPGYYVPAVLFFNGNEELDFPAIQAHVLRLAKVGSISHIHVKLYSTFLGWCNRNFGSGLQR